jgi:hypothetical protein
MEIYIKYQRFEKQTTEDKIQEFFDELVQGGWEIIYYSEFVETRKSFNTQRGIDTHENMFRLVAVCGKRANLIKNIL